ncbi:uncharacterized protein [Aristolochia californica]|uniref:uncharacterized protein n=1 Tax=Aristolochia californica TaxID=171875 RepID=UPI0035DE1B4F
MVGTSYEGKSPAAYQFAKNWHEQVDIAKSYLHKATKWMKKHADGKRRPLEFKVGDFVMIKLPSQQFKALHGKHKGLVRRYEGPYPIIKRVGNVSYQVQLPPSLKIHPVFHASILKPYHADAEDPSRGVSKRAPPLMTSSFDKEVEYIISDRVKRRRGVQPKTEYLVKWRGLPKSEASWEEAEALWQFEDQITMYKECNKDVA